MEKSSDVNDSTTSACGDTVGASESLLNYILAISDTIDEDSTARHRRRGGGFFSYPDILHTRNRFTPAIRYDVCMKSKK